MQTQQFFEQYGDLSLKDDPKAMARLYAPTFIAAGPQGSMAFTNDDRFLDWLREVGEFNRKHGMRSLEPLAIRETELSPIHKLVSVRWGAKFDKTGDRLIEFEIAYLLEKETILAYISERDQEEEMKKLGLL